MSFTLTNPRNMVYLNKEETLIKLTVDLNGVTQDNYIASEFDNTEQVRTLYADIEAGKYGQIAAYVEPEPAPVTYKKLTPVQFKLLFTADERIAIGAARTSDAYVEDFFSILDDVRLTTVDLGLKSTQDGLAYLAAKGLIKPERIEEILTGELV